MVHQNSFLKGLWPPLPGTPVLSLPGPAVSISAMALLTHSSSVLSPSLQFVVVVVVLSMKRTFSSLYAMPFEVAC